MNLRPLTPAESEKIASKGFNPGEYVANNSGQAIHRSTVAGMDAPTIQQSFGISPRDAAIYAERGPITSALTEGLNRMGAGLFGAAGKLTGVQALENMRAEAQTVAELMASKRQPGTRDTLLGLGAGLATQLPMYMANFPAAAAINAVSAGGEGAQRVEEAGGSGGTQAANALMRGVSSAGMDVLGAKYAVPAAKAIMQSARPAAQKAGAMLVPGLMGAAENVGATVGMNVADKYTFDPSRDIKEGTATSALVGFAVPAAVGARQAFGTQMQTRSPRSVLEEGARLGYDKRQAFVDQINKQYPDLFEGSLTIERLGGAEGNRMSDDAIRAIIDLASRAGEAPPLGSPNQQLVAQLARSGLIDPTNIAEARRVLNEGPTAFADIQARGAGLLAASRANEVTAAQQAAEAAARGDVSASVRGVAEREAADQAAAREAAQAAEAARQAEATKRSAGVAAEMKNIVEGKVPYAPDAPLAHLVGGKPGVVERPMSAEQTLLAEREIGAAKRMQEKAAADKLAADATAIQQTAATGVPAPETIVTGEAAKAPIPAAKKEDIVTAKNAVTAATTAPTVPAVGKDAAIKPGAPSQAGTGPKPAAKSAPAPTSVQFKPAEPSAPTSGLRVPEGVSQTPSTAAVVEAAGAKETTPVSAPPVTSALPRIPEQVANDVQRVVMELYTRDRANPLRQQLIQLSQDVEAGVKPLSALTSALPKSEVASPVATVKAEPAKFSQDIQDAIKRGNLNEDGTMWLSGQRVYPTSDNVNKALNDPSSPSVTEIKRSIARLEELAATQKDATVSEVRRIGYAEKLYGLEADTSITSFKEALTNAKQALAIRTQYETDLRKAAGMTEPAKVTDTSKLTDAEKAQLQAELQAEMGGEQKLGSPERMRAVTEKEKARLPDDILNQTRTIDGLRSSIAELEPYAKGTKAGDYDQAQYKERLKARRAELKAATEELRAMQQAAKEYGLPSTVAAIEKAAVKKSTTPAPLKIKSQTADPVAADKALLDAVGLVVRKKPDGNYELYNKEIDEVVRPLGGAANEAEAIGAAARAARSPARTPSTETPKARLKSSMARRAAAAAEEYKDSNPKLAAEQREISEAAEAYFKRYGQEPDGDPRGIGAINEEEGGSATRKPGGLGSKMRPSTGEEGFVAVPEFVESAGKAVGSAVRSGLSRIRSATQQLADYGDRAGDETAKYGARRLNETATVAAVDAQKIINENQRTWNALSAKEREELTDILQYERAQRIAYAGRMSPRVKNAYFETRGLLRELGERAAREGPRIQEGKEWRPLIVDEFWVPESLSGKIIKQLQDTSIDKATGRTVRDGLIEEVRNWWRQNGMSEDQINTEIKRFDIESRTGDADIEFDALHRPMTLPLPPGWAGNTQDAINRYAQKYAFEMARHKYIDQDALLGPMSRGQRQSLDNLGRLTARPFEAGEVGETTESMFRAALNSFALQLNPGRQTAAQRLSNVANPLAVQTGATVRDAVNMMGTLVDDAGVKNAFKGLFEGVAKYRDLKARGLVRDTGNLSGDWQRVGEAFENGQVLETIRDAVRLANRGTGVDALNKLMQAVSSAAGIARAKEAMVKGDEAFFRRVGIPEWRAKTPAEVEDYVARWVVEGSQGSMGAKDQPTHMLKSSGFGAQFMPIMRWSFAFSNQQIDRAIKPLLDANLSPAQRVKPMFTRLVGAAAATTAANTLLQTIFGRDDRNITFKEWQAAGYPNKLKYAAQKLTDLQVLPIVTAAANVLTGGQQMPRNIGVEIIPNVVNQVAALAETKREFTQEDYMKAVDAIVDRAVSNWRDVSKVVGGETKDPIEQARARYENMNTAVRPAAMANPLNLTAQFNDAKTAPEALAIARRIVETATLETPDVSVRGPSEDAAFDKWLEKTDPALSRQYRLDNMTKAQGLDTVYNTKRALAEAVNAALEKKRALLMSKEPNEVKRAQGVKIDWESGGYRMK